MKKLILFILLCCSTLLYSQYYYKEYYNTKPITHSEWVPININISKVDSLVTVGNSSYIISKVLRQDFKGIFYKDSIKGYIYLKQ